MNDGLRNPNTPLVSIITPHKNRIKYLEECIQSVMRQDYPNVEHIVVDGQSTDGTPALLEKYRSLYPGRLRYLSEPDDGAGQAWSKGLKMAEGEIFGWIGSDDMLHGNQAVSTVVRYFLAHPDAKFVHGACNFVSEKKEFIFRYRAGEVTLKRLLAEDNPISCSSAYYLREVVETVGDLDRYGNDFDYMIRIAKLFRMDYMEDVLSDFRIHGESETGNLESYVEVQKKDYLVVRKHGGSVFSKRARRYFMLRLFKNLGLLSLVPAVKKIRYAAGATRC